MACLQIHWYQGLWGSENTVPTDASMRTLSFIFARPCLVIPSKTPCNNMRNKLNTQTTWGAMCVVHVLIMRSRGLSVLVAVDPQSTVKTLSGLTPLPLPNTSAPNFCADATRPPNTRPVKLLSVARPSTFTQPRGLALCFRKKQNKV